MTDDEPPDGGGTKVTATGRYDRLSLGVDGVVVYERDQTDAWIQSDVVVTVPVRRPIDVTGSPDDGGSDDAGSRGE